MDFTFTDDQLRFREAMSRFLMTEAAPEMLREIWETDAGRSPALRGKGLGRVLIQECFAQALELGLAKLCVQMTVDQRAAIAGFEGIGFRAEALFRNHVKDRDGKLHDLAVLSHDVSEVESMMHAYGIDDAVGA